MEHPVEVSYLCGYSKLNDSIRDRCLHLLLFHWLKPTDGHSVHYLTLNGLSEKFKTREKFKLIQEERNYEWQSGITSVFTICFYFTQMFAPYIPIMKSSKLFNIIICYLASFIIYHRIILHFDLLRFSNLSKHCENFFPMQSGDLHVLT